MTTGRCVAAAALLAITVAGCSAGVEELPLPAPGLSGPTYQLNAEFSNALNLPDRAKVRVGGADVGEVVGMTAKDYTAVVQMRILDGIRLPKGTTAELRSATPLGDVFVSLTPPAAGSSDTAVLGDGDRIGQQSTTAAATVEQVLATTSMIVNGGVIRNLTRMLNGVGGALGNQGEGLTSLIHESRALVSTMADRSDEIRAMLDTTARLADQLNARRGTVNDLLDSASPALLTLADNTSAIVDLVDEIGAVTTQLQKFPAIAGTDTRSWIHDLNTLSAAFNEASVDPRVTMANFLRFLPPALKLFGSNAAAADVDLQQVAIGHIPDMNHYADPGFTGPKWANWDNMVGSIRFVLTQLGDRVWGPDRGQIWGPPQ
ncbi:MCE family protein [Mycobacterium sp. TNTM28]|uniref:MCE family protein n=1 Tax=[Mycobacterium] fortunisiensis TaxID=2600579 RepID=A0ABS6KJN4_9MYCO|nr:MlaD family protein [[Mycobacterium] fortunisiensis]MBU9763801.1 MCE family protein [[Mycobacterium] fortunisiensis]